MTNKLKTTEFFLVFVYRLDWAHDNHYEDVLSIEDTKIFYNEKDAIKHAEQFKYTEIVKKRIE